MESIFQERLQVRTRQLQDKVASLSKQLAFQKEENARLHKDINKSEEKVQALEEDLKSERDRCHKLNVSLQSYRKSTKNPKKAGDQCDPCCNEKLNLMPNYMGIMPMPRPNHKLNQKSKIKTQNTNPNQSSPLIDRGGEQTITFDCVAAQATGSCPTVQICCCQMMNNANCPTNLSNYPTNLTNHPLCNNMDMHLSHRIQQTQHQVDDFEARHRRSPSPMHNRTRNVHSAPLMYTKKTQAHTDCRNASNRPMSAAITTNHPVASVNYLANCADDVINYNTGDGLGRNSALSGISTIADNDFVLTLQAENEALRNALLSSKMVEIRELETQLQDLKTGISNVQKKSPTNLNSENNIITGSEQIHDELIGDGGAQLEIAGNWASYGDPVKYLDALQNVQDKILQKKCVVLGLEGQKKIGGDNINHHSYNRSHMQSQSSYNNNNGALISDRADEDLRHLLTALARDVVSLRQENQWLKHKFDDNDGGSSNINKSIVPAHSVTPSRR